jgi:Family of unknown function (DUF6790)
LACIFLIYAFVIDVGAVGFLFGFIPHVFFADQAAELIGWPKGSMFQFEVGLHDGAWGILGFLCVFFGGGFWLATAIGWSFFMLGAAWGHIRELRACLEAQREAAEALQRTKGAVIPWGFHSNGRPIKDLHKAWRAACLDAGYPGRIPHDFRRTAVRNLERAGVPRSTAMKMTGHKTESVYRRYAIVDEGMLREGSEKLTAGRRRRNRVRPGRRRRAREPLADADSAARDVSREGHASARLAVGGRVSAEPGARPETRRASPEDRGEQTGAGALYGRPDGPGGPSWCLWMMATRLLPGFEERQLMIPWRGTLRETG